MSHRKLGLKMEVQTAMMSHTRLYSTYRVHPWSWKSDPGKGVSELRSLSAYLTMDPSLINRDVPVAACTWLIWTVDKAFVRQNTFRFLKVTGLVWTVDLVENDHRWQSFFESWHGNMPWAQVTRGWIKDSQPPEAEDFTSNRPHAWICI